MSDHSDDDYLVGYARPPKQHQFKLGQSGNPAGRPPRKPLTQSAEQEILMAPLTATIGGKRKRVSSLEINILRMLNDALKGDVRSMGEFLKLCDDHEFVTPDPAPEQGGVIFAPKGISPEDWIASQNETPTDDEPST